MIKVMLGTFLFASKALTKWEHGVRKKTISHTHTNTLVVVIFPVEIYTRSQT